MLKISTADSQMFEMKIVRNSLKLARNHGALQASLNLAIYLSQLAHHSGSSGLKLEGGAQYDLARVLWDYGEMSASIQMLRQLNSNHALEQEVISISRPAVLADLVSTIR